MGTSTICEHPKGWRRYECPHGGEAVFPLRCRRCDACREAHQWRVIGEIASGIQASAWAAMVTLTTAPQDDGTWPEWSTIMRRFQSLVKALRSRYGCIEYAAVKEEGAQSGMRHLHVAVVGAEWIDHQVLRRLWQGRTGAWSVDVRRIRAGRAKEVASYLGKQRVSRKMVTYSKGYPRQPMESLLEDRGEEISPSALAASGNNLMLPTVTGGYVVHWGPGGPCDCFGELMDEAGSAKLGSTGGGDHGGRGGMPGHSDAK